MNLGGITSKIASKADILGLLGGFYASASAAGPASAMEEISWMFHQLIADPHIPDLGSVLSDLTQGASSNMVKTGLMMWFGGQLVGDFIGSKWANILEKGGIGAIKGAALFSLLMRSGAWHSPNGGADHSLGGGSHFPFLSGSRHNPHGHYTEPTYAPRGTQLTRVTASSLAVYP